MKLKTALGALLAVVVAGYLVGLMGDPFLFVVFFPSASLVSLLVAPFVVFSLLPALVGKVLGPDMGETCETHKTLFGALSSASLVFILLWALTVKRYGLSVFSHPVSLIGYGAILLFGAFLSWSLVKHKGKRTLCAGTAVFIILLSLLGVAASNSHGDAELSTTEALTSLGYVTWVPAEETIDQSGVVTYDREKSFQGINIYASRNLPTAYLMDMNGNVLHTWSAQVREDDTWHHVELCENGDLLSIVKDKMLIRLDWDSNVKWTVEMRAHHDIALARNGDIYVVSRKDDLVFSWGLPVPILNDYIAVFSPGGEIKKEISLHEAVKKEIPLIAVLNVYRSLLVPGNLKRWLTQRRKGQFIFGYSTDFDIFHTNTVEVIDRDIDGLCKEGDLLISVRELDLIGVLNVETEEIIWKWGPGHLSEQHHPTLLENGNILIFDNGVVRWRSRIVELNPLTEEIAWEYTRESPKPFFSTRRGGNQRLPNGNTLITNSDSGHVFEITRDGTVVWEFYNPEIMKKKKKRAAIYRMMRITDWEKQPKLKELLS